MKKFIIFALVIALLLSACSGGAPEPATTAKSIETTKAPESTEVVITTTEAAANTTEAIETTAAPSLSKEEAIDEYLNGAWDALKERSPDSTFSHSWTDGDLFINLIVPNVDYFYENWVSLDEGTKAEVIDIVHGYVSGSFAEPLYSGIREIGGDDFTVFFILVGKTVYCVSADLKIITDVFVR